MITNESLSSCTQIPSSSGEHIMFGHSLTRAVAIEISNPKITFILYFIIFVIKNLDMGAVNLTTLKCNCNKDLEEDQLVFSNVNSYEGSYYHSPRGSM